MAGFAFSQPGAGATVAPLVLLFERNDSIAVPLLSSIRTAGYDVRVARTPVELFDLMDKHEVALVVVDLGSATAGRREFWVALDSKRNGTAVQVLTFRVNETAELQEGDSAAALAVPDVRMRTRQELPSIVDAVRQRVPMNGAPLSPQLNSALGALSSMIPMGGGPVSQWNPGQSSVFGDPPFNPSASSVFAQPVQVNPFAEGPRSFAGPPSMVPQAGSPPSFAPGESSVFAAPLGGNPFMPGVSPASQAPNWPPSDSGRGPNAPSVAGGQSGVYNPAFGASQVGKPTISDSWSPPDGAAPPPPVASAPSTMQQAEAPTRWEDSLYSASMVRRPFEEPTPAKPAPILSPDEQALSEVLMDGALISPETLDVLKGVRQMLESVNMRMNIGELAMVFRFLSPDQLLAAILVSRNLLTPQQIAKLGRRKQELANEGKDYNLETLVAMSNLLTPQQLAMVRQEIGLAQG